MSAPSAPVTLKSVRERRDQLALHFMGQAVSLPRIGFTMMSISLRENASVLLSDDPEGDDMLREFEAENGMLVEEGASMPEPVVTEEALPWQQLAKDLKAASAKTLREVMFEAMADVKQAREARDVRRRS